MELLVCNGEGGCGKLISARVRQMGIIYLEVIKRAPNSASAAEVMTNMMIWEMVRTGLLHMGSGSFSDKNMWASTRMWPLD